MRNIIPVVCSLIIGFVLGLYVSDLGHLRAWWVVQETKNINPTDGHIQSLNQLELRRKLGSHLSKITPGYSTCEYCGWPWSLAEGHTVMYSESRGIFAVCEMCWKALKSFGRDEELVALYEKVAGEWGRESDVVELIGAAVRRDLRGPRIISVPVEGK